MIGNVKHYLESEIGINLFDAISIVLFTFVFIFSIVYTFGISKKHVDEMKKLPLNDQND